jgi:disulfide bond formation protein DsbB
MRGGRFRDAPDPAAHHARRSRIAALFGYHYYTWALIGFAAAIVLVSAMLLFDRQFENDGTADQATPTAFASVAVWLVIGLVALNVVSTLLMCGFGACADDPVVYEMLKRGR